jgi:hypothetical protein
MEKGEGRKEKGPPDHVSPLLSPLSALPLAVDNPFKRRNLLRCRIPN